MQKYTRLYLFFSARLVLAVIMMAVSPRASANDMALSNQSSAVVLAYHNVGADDFPGQNLRIDQFEEHVREIINGDYHVIALPDLFKKYEAGEVVAPKTIAITFEGGYRSALKNAIPFLNHHNLPYTIFYAASTAGRSNAPYMNWKELRELSKNKNVSFGLLPSGFQRLSDLDDTEALRQINATKTAHRERFGTQAQFLSYPYGVYGSQHTQMAEDSGFIAGFGIHSGAIYSASERYTLPRFSMTENHGGLERFRLVAHSLAFPAKDIEPAGSIIDTSQPLIGFTVPKDIAARTDSLSCFISGQGKVPVELAGETRIEIRVKEPLTTTRARVNCTIPVTDLESASDTPVWRWFGMLLRRAETTDQ